MTTAAVTARTGLYAALVTAASGRQTGPVVLLDPGWPAPQRDAAKRAVRRAAMAGEVHADDLVVFTSGSLGEPRAVVRRLASWLASAEPLTELLGIGPEDTVWLPGPLSSSLFAYGAYHAARIGAAVVLAGEPPAAAEAATVVHAVPAMLPALLDRRERGGLGGIRTVVVAGDRLPQPLRERAERAGWRVAEYYGAAELSFVGWREHDGPFRAFPGARVAVRGGELWVASPYLSRGYLGGVPGPCRRDGEWATVGDLGREVPGGFAVSGRGGAAVTVGGHTVVVEDVENALLAVPHVAEAAVVGVPHPRLGAALVAVVAGPRVDAVTDARLREAVAALPAAHRPRRFVRVDRLPRTGAGKPDRRALASLARAAQPHVSERDAPMTEQGSDNSGAGA